MSEQQFVQGGLDSDPPLNPLAVNPFDVIEHLDKIKALPVDRTVKGRWGEQAGLKHLLFNCPNCTLQVAMSGPGKIACPHCLRCVVEVLAP